MSNWTAASSDCSRPANNYVRVNTVDLYTPNARFTPERLGYQVLTLFGKLGYSPIIDRDRELCTKATGRGKQYSHPRTLKPTATQGGGTSHRSSSETWLLNRQD